MKFDIETAVWGFEKEERLSAVLVEFSDENLKEIKETGKLNYEEEPNEEIRAACFYQGLLLRIPVNLTDFFPNMTLLSICGCDIKAVSRFDFKRFERLTELDLAANNIEKLPSDLFIDLKDLEAVRLSSNYIRYIGKDIFKHLEKLRYVNLSSNPSIDLLFTDRSFEEFDVSNKSTRVFKFEELNKTLDFIFHPKCITINIF